MTKAARESVNYMNTSGWCCPVLLVHPVAIIKCNVLVIICMIAAFVHCDIKHILSPIV